MEKNTNQPGKLVRRIVYVALATGFLTAVAQPLRIKEEPEKETYEKVADGKDDAARREQESKDAFLAAYTVFMHPRCMNCHPSGDAPLQGDDSHIHAQNVTRGTDGKGLYALKCKNCHQDANLPGADMPPGSPGWAMPPAKHKMIFQGMSPKELATHFKDNHYTGFKDFEKDMIHHVEVEPLVLNSFIPLEGRSRLPMTHEEFVAKVKEWIEKGAAIPDK
ncbi:hypothetical protein [Foetidibacter luteolus]|uniref:hypothetical protein n=1 Tax=Foetidibacter luteolus TaxID=2608880 RepID=UPI00129B27E4|nr:hypothetical protein [Foetidibacter luteolus]